MWDGKITDGAAQLLHAGRSDQGRGSCLQVVSVKNIQQPSGVRLRVALSDGKYKISAVLASQVCTKVAHVNLEGAIVRINEFQLNGFNAGTPQKILLVTSMDVVGDKRPIIGNPIDLVPAPPSGAPQAKPAPQVAPVRVAPPPPVAASAPAPHQHHYAPPAAAGPHAQAYQVPAAAAAAAPPAAATAANAHAPDMDMGGPTMYGGPIDHGRVTAINGLNPYSSGNWTIKARCTNKSQIRPFKSKDGRDSKLFSVELVDQDGEIRATGFGNTVDNLYSIFQPGRVYYVSKGDVKQANKKFTGNINNNYEITFTHNTAVELAYEEADQIPLQHYHFARIRDLPDLGIGTTVDVVGVILEASDLTTRSTKNGPTSHRNLILGDNSKASVQLALWGTQAENSKDWVPGSILAVKSAKITDFSTLSLSVFSTSTLEINPSLAEALTLRTWYDSPEGQSTQWQALSTGRMRRDGDANMNVQHQPPRWMTFAEAAKLQQGQDLSPFYSYAYLTSAKRDAPSGWTYTACPKCNKKMQKAHDHWECPSEKCLHHAPEPVRRYTLQVAFQDFSGTLYTTAFNEAGERLLGNTATELHDLQEAGRTAELDFRFQDALFRLWKVKVNPKFDEYQQRQRLKFTLLDVEHVQFAEATKFFTDRAQLLQNS